MTGRDLRLTLNGATGTLSLDDLNLSKIVAGFTLRGGHGDVAVLTLDVVVFRVDGSGVVPRVVVPDATRDALIALGWTPPDDERADEAAS